MPVHSTTDHLIEVLSQSTERPLARAEHARLLDEIALALDAAARPYVDLGFALPLLLAGAVLQNVFGITPPEKG